MCNNELAARDKTRLCTFTQKKAEVSRECVQGRMDNERVPLAGLSPRNELGAEELEQIRYV